jgi:type I restriction enzyme S subunit
VFDKQVFSHDVSNYKLVRFDELAYNPSRIDVGSVARCHLPGGGAVSPMYVVVRCRETLSPQYLVYFLKSEIGRQHIAHRCVGAVRFTLRFQDLEQIELPLPPRSEQERIVRILDEADALRRLRAKAEKRTSEVEAALFGKMFGNSARDWLIDKFGNVGSLDRGRSQHRPRDEPSLFGGPFPFIQTGDVANAGGRITKYSQTYSEKGLAQSRLWPAGTLCITIAANIAKTAVLTFEACFPDSVVGFIPGERVTVEYVQAWLQTLQRALEDYAPQAAQKNINLKTLRELDLVVPPKEMQLKFADYVGKVRELRASQTASGQRLDDLFRSLLDRAFRGAL